MNPARTWRLVISCCLSIVLVSQVFVAPLHSEMQFPKIPKIPDIKTNPASLLGCAGGAAGALAVAKLLAEVEGKRLKLSSAETKKRERSYQLGLAMSGCGTVATLTGTAFAKLSERGKKQREDELQLAAADAMARTYTDPDNPMLEGRITPQMSYTESGKECRTIEDTLADAGKGETAYLKYCRQPDGMWKQEMS